VDLAGLPHHLSDPASLIWCDITGTEDAQQGPHGRLLREVFGFDELTIVDCFTTNHLPKVDIYDAYLFVAFFSFHLSEKRQRLETVEVDTFVGENHVVCIYPRPLRELRHRFLLGDEFVSASPANVAHTIFDAIVDEYLPIMTQKGSLPDSCAASLSVPSRPFSLASCSICRGAQILWRPLRTLPYWPGCSTARDAL
jgi:magnesium transporter